MRKIKNLSIVLILLTCSLYVNAQWPSDGLVGYWSFNGNANDGSVSGNDGVVTDASLAMDRNNVANSAYYFELEGKIEFTPIDLGTQYTICTWINLRDEVGMPLTIFNGGNFQVDEESGGFTVYSGNSEFGSYYIGTEQWMHIAITRNNNEMSLYVNGVLSNTAVKTDLPNETLINSVGGQGSLGNGPGMSFSGDMDELLMYTRPLSETEISQHYNDESIVPPAPPTIEVAVWNKLGSKIYNTDGNVGIGTADPRTKLQIGNNYSSTVGNEIVRICSPFGEENTIVDALHIDSKAGDYDFNRGVAISLGYKSETYGEYTSRIVHFSDPSQTRASKMQLQTHSSTQGVWNTGIFMDNIGNVGIGTTDPGAGFDVFKSTNDYWTARIQNDGGSSQGLLIHNGWGGASSSAVIIQLEDDESNVRMKVMSNGNVGIGTTNPTEKLEISGNIKGPDGESYIKGFKNIFGRSTDGILHLRAGTSTGSVFLNYYESGNVIIANGGGNVGIGTTSPIYKLSVKGTIGCGEIIVENTDGWADFVFENDYKLMSLKELDNYIKANKHLPEIPTTAEVEENGISVGQMNSKLLQKIEELTLHTIKQQELIETLAKRVEQLEKK
ncbi:MAG: hypothetical protein JEY96_04810 [Bacteroidales bacterium]|nr:hypothetical protein [Bacteroidales bacterium]